MPDKLEEMVYFQDRIKGFEELQKRYDDELQVSGVLGLTFSVVYYSLMKCYVYYRLKSLNSEYKEIKRRGKNE